MCDWALIKQHLVFDDPSRPIGLALSGGMDSVVLLHALKHSSISFSAYHVNHGLSPRADAWALHVQALCASMNVPFTLLTLTEKPPKGESIEAWARQARYAALIDALPERSILLTAHHQADQAETVLLQLMRGAGPKGLSGIAPTKQLCRVKEIELRRPLLSVPKKLIEAYAGYHALTWVEDESNAQLRFERNFMRHHVLPLLISRVPHAIDSMANSASHLQEQQQLVDMWLDEQMPACVGVKPGTLSIKALLAKPVVLQNALLRHWLAMHDVRMPSIKKLENLIQTVLKADEDATPRMALDAHVVVRYRDTLYIVVEEQLRSLSAYRFDWDPRDPLVLPHGAGTLTADDLKAVGITPVVGETIPICFRQGGETVFVPGVGHQSLKKWFQTRDVPVWQRERIPLVDHIKTVLPLLK